MREHNPSTTDQWTNQDLKVDFGLVCNTEHFVLFVPIRRLLRLDCAKIFHLCVVFTTLYYTHPIVVAPPPPHLTQRIVGKRKYKAKGTH